MSAIIFVFFCLSTGFLLKQFKIITIDIATSLGKLLITVFIPGLILFHFDSMKVMPNIGLIILPPWIVYGCSILFFNAIDYIKPFPNKKIKGVLILTAGISSVSFVGFPFFEAMYGKQGLVAGIIMSQAGTVLCASTLGVGTAAWYTTEKINIKSILFQVLKFPPTIAFIVAIILRMNDVHYVASLSNILEKISAAFQPIALLTIGFQINLKINANEWKYLGFGFFYKLIVAPTIIFLLFYFLGNTHSMIAEVSIIGAAIGSMNTTAIIAQRFNLEPDLANKMVGFTIPVSFVFVFIFYFMRYSL